MTRCAWCGDDHPVERLCAKAQRGRSRRSFLFLTSSAVVGLALAPSLSVSPPSGFVQMYYHRVPVLTNPHTHASAMFSVSKSVAKEWERMVGQQLSDVVFDQRFPARR